MCVYQRWLQRLVYNFEESKGGALEAAAGKPNPKHTVCFSLLFLTAIQEALRLGTTHVGGNILQETRHRKKKNKTKHTALCKMVAALRAPRVDVNLSTKYILGSRQGKISSDKLKQLCKAGKINK